MRIQVKLFAVLRELYGAQAVALDLPDGSTVGTAMETLFPTASRTPRFPGTLLFAVNRQYAPADRALQDGDELVFVPPVSGG